MKVLTKIEILIDILDVNAQRLGFCEARSMGDTAYHNYWKNELNLTMDNYKKSKQVLLDYI